MSIKGFIVNGSTQKYDYNELDNKPTINGIPSGGSAGQVLAKNSSTNYDVTWVNQSGGGGSSVPSVVTTSEQMTNSSMIYIYGGSEPGYTSGNWYFYNSGVQAWVSGGVYCGITTQDLQQALSTFLANNSTVLTNADTTSF